MGTLLSLIIIIGFIFYSIELFLNPDKHVVALVIIAIIYAIFASFYETTGAKADYDRKKRG